MKSSRVVSSDSAAKVNLSLRILGRYRSGYHRLSSIVVPCSLTDVVSLEALSPSSSQGIRIELSLSNPLRDCVANLPAEVEILTDPERNLASKAIKAYFERAGERCPPIKLSIHKSIPWGAGLGGGSSNAACVLRLLSKYWPRGFDSNELLKLAAALGSDVPVCLLNRPTLMRGRGQFLHRIESLFSEHPLSRASIWICKPPITVSTAEAYSELGFDAQEAEPPREPKLSAVEEMDLENLGWTLGRLVKKNQPFCPEEDQIWRALKDESLNSFLLPLCKKHHAMDAAYRALQDFGASSTLLTGSGSAFVIFSRSLNDKGAFSSIHGSLLEGLAGLGERGWLIQPVRLFCN